ncbi:hypothetical protein LDFHOB_14045 [Candidatus Electronema aureum]
MGMEILSGNILPFQNGFLCLFAFNMAGLWLLINTMLVLMQLKIGIGH